MTTSRSSALIVGSTTDQRQLWREEAIRTRTDWKSLIELHCAIVDRLRASSSWTSSYVVAVIMTACATCGADPCANPGFCALCRDADARKAHGEPPRCAPLRPAPPPMADLPKANLESKSGKEVAAEAWDGWKQAALEYHHGRGERTLTVETPPESLKRLRRLLEFGCFA